MKIPVDELPAVLKKFLKGNKAPYDVSFHLTEAAEVEQLYLILRGGPSTPELRALKAEHTLRQIALVLLQARVSKDFDVAHEVITEIHNAWVDDRVPII